MAERPKNKAPARVSRKGQRRFHNPGTWPDAAQILAALARAWTVTIIATTFLAAALTIAPIWDTAIYLRALHDTLSGGPAPALPSDEDPAGLATRVRNAANF